MAKPIQSEAPKRIFKTQAPVKPQLVVKPGYFDANGHNVVIDWRNPAEIALSIAVDAEALKAAYVPTKDGVAGNAQIAKTEGTRFGGVLVEIAGEMYYLSAALTKARAK